MSKDTFSAVALSHRSLCIKQVKRDSYVMEAHFHPYYEICYLFSGERYFFVRDRTYHMLAGDLILIPANELHRSTDAGQSVYEKLEINFLMDYVKPFQTMITQQELLAPFEREELLIRLSAKDQEYFTFLFFRLKEELKQRNFGYTIESGMLLMQILIFVERLQRNSPRVHNISPVYFHAKATNLIHFINNNYKKKLTLSMLAQRYQYHPSYLSILFKNVTGFTLSEYLNNMRIKASQQLLEHSNMDIMEIALECGFNSLSHYGRVFKQIVGKSPSEYRKSVKEALFHRIVKD